MRIGTAASEAPAAPAGEAVADGSGDAGVVAPGDADGGFWESAAAGDAEPPDAPACAGDDEPGPACVIA
jgi:hypothetical protein